ncbi:MAG: 3-oxoacid CoA-transferase subunit B [Chloroflexi bacterium]|nr:3-oxoacid CoA-transferase subunit B [Chloroflexota bacterium]
MQEKQKLDRETIALRVAKEFQDGDVVNLGLGLPGLASNFVPSGREVLFQAEIGVLGFGELTAPGEGDYELVNASGQTVREQPGMSCFDHAESFVMIRGGHVDISVMGAFQVSEKGDLANYMVPERKIGTIGGAMDLAIGTKKLIVAMNHTTKDGQPRILKKCTYPITALNCVDLIVTDIAVMEVIEKGLLLREVAPGWTPEEVQQLTEPALIVDPDCQEITLM